MLSSQLVKTFSHTFPGKGEPKASRSLSELENSSIPNIFIQNLQGDILDIGTGPDANFVTDLCMQGFPAKGLDLSYSNASNSVRIGDISKPDMSNPETKAEWESKFDRIISSWGPFHAKPEEVLQRTESFIEQTMKNIHHLSKVGGLIQLSPLDKNEAGKIKAIVADKVSGLKLSAEGKLAYADSEKTYQYNPQLEDHTYKALEFIRIA